MKKYFFTMNEIAFLFKDTQVRLKSTQEFAYHSLFHLFFSFSSIITAKKNGRKERRRLRIRKKRVLAMALSRNERKRLRFNICLLYSNR